LAQALFRDLLGQCKPCAQSWRCSHGMKPKGRTLSGVAAGCNRVLRISLWCSVSRVLGKSKAAQRDGDVDGHDDATAHEGLLDGLINGDRKNQCHTNQDYHWWKNIGRDSFDHDMTVCGEDCWGKGACVKDCVRRRGNYTEGCATCFGHLAVCTAMHCWFSCVSGETAECDKCNRELCAAAFMRCSGIPSSEIHGAVLRGMAGALQNGVGSRRLSEEIGHPSRPNAEIPAAPTTTMERSQATLEGSDATRRSNAKFHEQATSVTSVLHAINATLAFMV